MICLWFSQWKFVVNIAFVLTGVYRTSKCCKSIPTFSRNRKYECGKNQRRSNAKKPVELKEVILTTVEDDLTINTSTVWVILNEESSHPMNRCNL